MLKYKIPQIVTLTPLNRILYGNKMGTFLKEEKDK